MGFRGNTDGSFGVTLNQGNPTTGLTRQQLEEIARQKAFNDNLAAQRLAQKQYKYHQQDAMGMYGGNPTVPYEVVRARSPLGLGQAIPQQGSQQNGVQVGPGITGPVDLGFGGQVVPSSSIDSNGNWSVGGEWQMPF